MKKTFKLLALILAVLFALCGCGEKVEEQSVPAMAKVEENSEIRLTFMGCGDNITYVGNVIEARENAVSGGREHNFKPTYENVLPKIENADIAFINQETVMAGEGYPSSYYPTFNSPQDLGYDVEEMGFDVVNIATNHMLDMGAGGLSKTIDFWKAMDVLMIGGYENEEDFNTIRIYEEQGVKIAFLSFTYATNGISKPASSELVIPYINDEDIISQIESAKQKADMVFVSMHWGTEGAFKPNDEQKRVAQLIADFGADAIIGHHPHVIQPVQWLTGKDGNKTLCVYSLGNFVAEQAYDYNMVGGIIEFEIVKNGNEKPHIENPVFTPTMYHFERDFRNNKVYYLQDYTKELANKHAVSNYYGNKMLYDRLYKYVTDTIDKEFLPKEFAKKYCK